MGTAPCYAEPGECQNVVSYQLVAVRLAAGVAKYERIMWLVNETIFFLQWVIITNNNNNSLHCCTAHIL